MSAILKVLQLNYFMPHDYFDMGYALVSPTRGFAWVNDCAGSREPLKRGIAGLMLENPEQPGFHRLAQEVNPHALVRPVDAESVVPFAGGKAVQQAWEIVIDPAAPAAERSDWADVTGRDMWDLDNSRHVYFYERYDAAAG